MANIKSAQKRIKIITKKTLRNKMIKSQVKTATKKVLTAVNEGNKTLAETTLRNAISKINKASTKGIFHKNNAARKVSQLTKMVNSMGQ
ncbi:MAG: 30S ribosomal protein S20 [Epulopiscium sp.]|nr:30S ribosomal protein S20 [Candidatus Epulonipiscium sp.]